eukprot:1160449-Pelagomonas_calceolata.AAC.8
MQDDATRARQALGGSSFPAPRSLLVPPTTGLCLGKILNKTRGKKSAWVWDQYTRQMKLGSAAASGDPALEGGQQEQQQQQQQMMSMECEDSLKSWPGRQNLGGRNLPTELTADPSFTI